MENFKDTTKFLLEISQKASEIMLRHYSGGGVELEVKEDMSTITKADIEVNSMVISEVKNRFPNFGVLAEEESTQIDGVKNLFVVDPIDGTLMFTIGCPLFVFSAAVVIDGESVAGILANPLAKRTLLAEKNMGTYLVEKNEKVRVGNKKTFDGALINAGWDKNEAKLSSLLHEKGANTMQVYSVCEASSLVATGGFEGEVFTGVMAHDIAAAKIVVEEAGGKVTDLEGNEQRYDGGIKGAIISNGHLHRELLNLVKKAGIYQKT